MQAATRTRATIGRRIEIADSTRAHNSASSGSTDTKNRNPNIQSPTTAA